MNSLPPLSPRSQNEGSKAWLGGLSLLGLTVFAALVVFYRPNSQEGDMALSAVTTRIPLEDMLPRVAGPGRDPLVRTSGSMSVSAEGGPIGEKITAGPAGDSAQIEGVDPMKAQHEALLAAEAALQKKGQAVESALQEKRTLEARENFKNDGFNTGPSAGGQAQNAGSGGTAVDAAPGAGGQERGEGLLARSRSNGESAPRMPSAPRVGGGSERIGAVGRAPLISGHAQTAQAGTSTQAGSSGQFPAGERLEARTGKAAAASGGVFGGQARDTPPSGGSGPQGGTGGGMGAPPVGAGAPAPPCMESAEYTMWKNDGIRRDGEYQAQRDACNGVTEQNDARQKCHESLDKAFKESPPKPTCQEPDSPPENNNGTGGQGDTDQPIGARSGPPAARDSCDRVTDARARTNCHNALDNAFGK